MLLFEGPQQQLMLTMYADRDEQHIDLSVILLNGVTKILFCSGPQVTCTYHELLAMYYFIMNFFNQAMLS